MGDEVIGLAAVILIFGGGGAILFSITPIGKAIAARILGKKGASEADDATIEEVQDLRREVEELRAVGQQVNELGERVDFLERLIAKQREAERLAPPGGR
ncbi:MAG TPA: hypothetical protein VG454_13160 [Gemmatimonadales bacterium]|nr:hypothetical protein [Gemmatimonadales bacterium]